MALSLLNNSMISAGLGAGFTASLLGDVLLNGNSNNWRIVNAQTGQDAIAISSFLSCDVVNESAIVDGPVEEGAFASYNKVQKPLEVKVSIAVMGDDGLLGDSLSTIKQFSKSTELLNVITPTAEYRDLNIEKYNYTQKTENGRGVLYIDLSFKEIKQVKSQTSNEKIPTQQQRGKVQASDKGKVQEKNQSLIFMGKNSNAGQKAMQVFGSGK